MSLITRCRHDSEHADCRAGQCRSIHRQCSRDTLYIAIYDDNIFSIKPARFFSSAHIGFEKHAWRLVERVITRPKIGGLSAMTMRKSETLALSPAFMNSAPIMHRPRPSSYDDTDEIACRAIPQPADGAPAKVCISMHLERNT